MIFTCMKMRNPDNYGSGHFGASRGSRTHNGIDYVCDKGSPIHITTPGKVTKLGYPYGDDLSFRYVQVTDEKGLAHRVFYVEPSVSAGDLVTAGTVLGTSQDLTKRYPNGMTNHVHYEIKNGSEYINPEDA